MQVASRVMPTAKTEISDDGQALVVHRFDVDVYGQPYWGMEDFCSLLGLRPAAKYDTTWERIAKADMRLSPTYDMLTTSVYGGFQHNPPAIEFMGKKTWVPGKNLQNFIAATFGIQPKDKQQMVEALSDAVTDVGPLVRQAMTQHPAFEDIGKRMLMAWAEGVQGLHDQRV